MRGLLGMSYALEEIEPSRCNIALARIIEGLIQEKGRDNLFIVVQWEIALQLERDRIMPDFVVGPFEGRQHLKSEEVISRAAAVFRQKGIEEIEIVANRFLHLYVCQLLVARAGFRVVESKIPAVGFNKESIQWWTRGPLQTVLYIALEALKGRHGRMGIGHQGRVRK